MASLRPYRRDDASALARICLKPADAGSDASGMIEDDDLWAELFVLPYLERHPDLAFVVVSAEDRPIGYIVGTDDSVEFAHWFGTVWWPRHTSRWPMPASIESRQDALIAYGYSRADSAASVPEGYPAHLHIDLLPEAQGAGWGRVLITELAAALRTRQCAGLHATASTENVGALAFYPRLGFVSLSSDGGSETFGLSLA